MRLNPWRRNRCRRNPWAIDVAWTGKKADYVSPVGDWGIVPSSELAMHTRIADKPVVQYALWSDVGRWPHVTWAQIQTSEGQILDGLPSEVLPDKARYKHGDYNRMVIPGAKPRKRAMVSANRCKNNPMRQYAVYRFQYVEMKTPQWGAVEAKGEWRDQLPPTVLSKPGILGIVAKTKKEAIRRAKNQYELDKKAGFNRPRKAQRNAATNPPIRKLTGGDRHMIQQIVSRLHVGTPDEKVLEYLRSRMTKSIAIHPLVMKQIEKVALKVHRDNQDLYRRVMSGRL
jgi:hypothetical protein